MTLNKTGDSVFSKSDAQYEMGSREVPGMEIHIKIIGVISIGADRYKRQTWKSVVLGSQNLNTYFSSDC